MKDLTKQEARWILSAVVDNEATDEEGAAFFAFIKNEPEVEKEYNHALLIKRALSTSNIRKKAPDEFRKVILETIEGLKIESESGRST